MNDLIKTNLSSIQTVVKDSLESVVSGLRVSSAGNLQLFLSEQVDSGAQDEFQEAINAINPDLAITYQENLDEYGEPATYNNKGKKTQLSPAFIVHPVREKKSLDTLFSDLLD